MLIITHNKKYFFKNIHTFIFNLKCASDKFITKWIDRSEFIIVI